MDALIKKSASLSGSVTAPGSKSYTHRVIAAASLYGGTVLIQNPSNSDANAGMIEACRKFGAKIDHDGGSIRVVGVNGHPAAKGQIHMGNSGTAMRIVVALASLADGTVTITGDASLQSRPTKALLDALRDLGADMTGIPKKTGNTIEEYVPVTVNATGSIRGGPVEISCKKSSQYLTALLLIGNFAQNDTEIIVKDELVSKPYVKMTLEILRNFGLDIEASDDLLRYRIRSQQQYRAPDTYRIPGDYSQAAFALAAACLVSSNVRVRGLDPADQQGDKMIVDILKRMGAVIEKDGTDLVVRGPFELHGAEIDLVDAPDLFPVLAVLGVYASGKTRLYNMPQIRSKETDRIAVMERELTKYGVKVETKEDEMTVYHTDLNQEEYVFSARGDEGVSDHRVSMALSLIGMCSGNATIRDAQSIDISYPDYIADMRGIGAEIEEI